MPAFLLASDLRPQGASWRAAQAQLDCIREDSARVLGFDPYLRLACMPEFPGDAEPAESLPRAIDEAAAQGENEIFVLPAALDFSLWQREALGHVLAEARRRHPTAEIHHDDVDLAHPLLIDTLASQAAGTLATMGVPPQGATLLLVSSGHGDPASRAQSYRLMRLIWEQLGFAQGEVGFVRNARPFLLHVLTRCASPAAGGLRWVLLPQAQWETEHVEYARVILTNFQRSEPGFGTQGSELAEPRNPGFLNSRLQIDGQSKIGNQESTTKDPESRILSSESLARIPNGDAFGFAAPPGDHPLLTALYAQRVTRLWQEKRQRIKARLPSVKGPAPAEEPTRSRRDSWRIARVSDRDSLAEALRPLLPSAPPERVLVKVTWHGYATGTYTDPAALELLLGALPAPAIVLEGHTSSRNLGGASFDWETQAREHRTWIRQQEAEYLRRTGLAEVMARHRAQYLNVTEVYWDEDCSAPEEIERLLAQHDVCLDYPELAGFVPSALLQFRGCPLISFAKFKGPTRLGISNMFGLIPEPLRSAWHGPNITWFASVCCNLARLYGSLFQLCGVVEGIFSAVRWNHRGMYRSRWGNYDLNLNAGYITASRGLVSADILASRLQGQDVTRSSFFDVVREKLGWDNEAANEALPEHVGSIFV
jgi:sirohydrochlorin ferrochelatase